MFIRLLLVAAVTLAGGLVLSLGEPGSPAVAARTNLVKNGTFEARTASWKLCGGAGLSDTARSGKSAAADGRYAIRLGNPTRGACPNTDDFWDEDVYQALYQKVAIPASAKALTVSFWYYVDGKRNASLEVGLAPTFNSNSYDDGAVFLRSLSSSENPGWQEFRQVLTAKELRIVKGKTVFLEFRFPFELEASATQAFRIDDVQVVPAAVKTAVTRKAPAALRGDGARPIAFIRSINRGDFTDDVLYRMDTDGTKPVAVYEGFIGEVSDPEWSPDGKTIAVVDETIANNQRNSAITLVDAATGQDRVLRRLPAGNEDFTQLHDGVSWSPNGQYLAASIFAWDPDSTSPNGFARIERISAAKGQAVDVLEYATDPDWGKKNRLIFEGYDLVGDQRGWGIFDALMTSTKPKSLAVIPGTLFDADDDPTWAPDGQRFVTVRYTGARRFEGKDDYPQQVIMLFDRKDPRNGRQILLADFGAVSDPTWSPDGTFLLFTAGTSRGSNIWWLDVASGATGPLTTNNTSSEADWRSN